MIAAVLSYIVGIVFMANIGEVHTPLLVVLDWVFAVMFVISGSIAGWQSARQ